MPPKKPEPTFEIPESDANHVTQPTQNLDPNSIPRFHNPNSQQPTHQAEPTPFVPVEPQSTILKPSTPQTIAHAKVNLSPTSTQSMPMPDDKKAVARKKLEKLRKHSHWKTIRFAIVSFVVFLLIFNFQLVYSQIVYNLTPKPPSQATNIPSTPVNPVNVTKPQQPAEVVGPENLLIIPKINLNAPLVFIDSVEEQDVLQALHDGVVHYAGTAKPGENGNAVFFGHSSNDWWEKGNYKFVFVLLEKLAPGDTYEIHYQSRKYVYQVESTKTVLPTDLSVLDQTTTPYSTLITCTPPGTTWKRFIVKAKQIAPEPSTPAVETVQTANTPTGTPAQTAVLPSASPAIFSQIQTAILNFFSSVFGRTQSEQPSPTSPQGQPVNRLPEVSTQTKMPSTF